MMPLRKSNRQSIATGRSIPAGVGGWNTRDPIESMDPKDALILDNWFPETGRLRLRRGHADHATGIGVGSVETLMIWNGPSSSKMLACGNSAIYDATTSGAVGAALVSSLTNNRFQYVNFGTAGGDFIIFVNGADACQRYDGSTITANAITHASLTSDANLIHVNAFKERLFFIEANTLTYYYLPVQTLSGAASRVNLSSLFRLGGHLMAMGSWTRDGGSGPDDVAVFITSEGEVAVYAGTDPSDAAEWALVGVFRIGAPIGRRCMIKGGSDLLVITQDGFVPLSGVLPVDRATAQKQALSDKISPTVNEAARSYSANFGWEPIIYPRGQMLLFNIPTAENSVAHQYVANTITGAWCRFKGMNANCWGLLNDELYFGANDGTVKKADTGADDDGANIDADLKTAFNYFGNRGQLKRFTMCRPIFASNGNLAAAVDLNIDYGDSLPTSVPSTTGNDGPEWDAEFWDDPFWGSDALVTASWTSVSGLGYSAAVRVRVSTMAVTAYLNAIDIIYERGGFV